LKLQPNDPAGGEKAVVGGKAFPLCVQRKTRVETETVREDWLKAITTREGEI